MSDLENYAANLGYRKKRSRRRFWIVLNLLFFLLACAIGLIYFVLNSPWLTVRNFSVPDFPGVSGSELLNALKTRMYGNRLEALLGADNILFWKLGGVPENISQFPGVDNISDETDLFDRSVKLSAEQRNLWGVVCGAGDSGCYGLDESGVIFSRVPDVSGSLLLKISDTNSRTYLLGQSLFSDGSWFSNIKSATEAIQKNNLKVVDVELGSLSLREWTAKIANGPVFQFSLTFTPDKLDLVINNLKSKINFNKTSYIDFRVPNRVYYK